MGVGRDQSAYHPWEISRIHHATLSTWGHAYGQVFETAHEVGVDPRRLSGQLDIGEAGENLFEFHPQGQPRQMDPQAVMLAVGEPEVPVALPRDIEAERVVEVVLVAIGGGR